MPANTLEAPVKRAIMFNTMAIGGIAIIPSPTRTPREEPQPKPEMPMVLHSMEPPTRIHGAMDRMSPSLPRESPSLFLPVSILLRLRAKGLCLIIRMDLFLAMQKSLEL